MASLTDFAKPKVSIKKGAFAFKKRRKAIAGKTSGIPMAKKFKVAPVIAEDPDNE